MTSIGAEDDGSAAPAGDEQEADAGMSGEPGEQARVQLLEILERHAARQPSEVDETEVAGGEDDEFGSAVGLLGRPRSSRALPHGSTSHRTDGTGFVGQALG